MFVYENLELALELGLLRSVGKRVIVGGHAGHILEHHEAELIARLVEQVGLDFDLQLSARTEKNDADVRVCAAC